MIKICKSFCTIKHNPKVFLILGGPGSGKGTQSGKLVKEFNFIHLSAGELLRNEMKKNNEDSHIIDDCIKNGKIVPSRITVKLLLQSMYQDQKATYLIDGFPRNYENMQAWENASTGKIDFRALIYLVCSKENMIKRIMTRAQSSNRTDDNILSLEKRFITYENETKPIINHYDQKGKVYKVHIRYNLKSFF